MARSGIIALLTFGTVGIAAVISLIWFSVSSGQSRFEPAVGLLGLLGGIAGILAERRAAVQERRRVVLSTLTDELRRATAVLDDLRPAPSGNNLRVYPRLPVSAIEAALVSGALSERGDADLLNQLHRWRDEANGFNRRLEITEMCVFGVSDKETAAREMAEFDRALHQVNGYLDQTRRRLQELRKVLGEPAPAVPA